jgi:hypothetical protein
MSAGKSASPWRRRLIVGGAALAGLVVGVGIGAAGKTQTKTVTVAGGVTTIRAVAQAPTHTVTRVVVHTHTVTQTAASAPAPAPESSGSYSGNGTKSLGTIVVPQTSVIHWHAEGGLFAIDNSAEDAQTIALSSKAASGETVIEAGTYHQVQVLATGEWGFTITSQG